MLLHRYIQIPQTFWTRGHIAVLSGAAVAMFLALLCENGGLGQDVPLRFSPRDAEGRFALSEDTRSKGLRELGNAGLITTRRRPVNESDFQAEALYMWRGTSGFSRSSEFSGQFRQPRDIPADAGLQDAASG
ncbi:hypothetical protein AB0478_40210 [Streptomyces sp. NPDC051917]|uniref:hypothetical protein n=1 Tax=Streptomyces sp. NPDC051917 TaxID=3154754 RepID=UPI0034521E67